MKYLVITFFIGGLCSWSVSAQEYLRMIDAGIYSVSAIQEEAESYFEDVLSRRFSEEDPYRGTGYKSYKRWEYRALKMMDAGGYLKDQAYYIGELERYQAQQNRRSSQDLGDYWSDLGPDEYVQTSGWNPGVGRVPSFSIDENDETHIIAGAQTGGLWRTRDGGTSWEPLTDYFSNLYVYSTAIRSGEPDVYYFGSDYGYFFRSEDAGATWHYISKAGNSIINRILIHPDNPDIIFASSQNDGLYRSNNGGISWISIVPTNGFPDPRGFDFQFKPNDPSVVYASGIGVHRSIDGGETFQTIGASDLFNSDIESAKMIGISEADPEVVYVLESDDRRYGALYKSTDGGDTFEKFDHDTINYFGYSIEGLDDRGQAPRDMAIAVNPNDAEEVHIAGIHSWRSTDGGRSFTITSHWIPQTAESHSIGYCHADVDIMQFYGSTLYVGSDGGLFKATNTRLDAPDYYTDLSKGLGIRQFYKIGLSQTDPVIVSGGSQDNGTSVYTQGNWLNWLGADGMETIVSHHDESVLYGTTQNGNLYVSYTGGLSYDYLSRPDEEGNWVTPFEQDPVDPVTFYTGHEHVHKTTDNAQTWTPISQYMGFEPSISNLKVAPSDNQILYASREDELYKTSDGGSSDWQLLTGYSGHINCIAIHPTNSDKVAIATTDDAAVFVSEDGGQTWASYKKNLPGFAAFALAWHDNGQDGLYLGMNYGIFYIDTTFDEWQSFNNNLPNVIIYELEINNADGHLYAATYGRGLWASPLYDPVHVALKNHDAYERLKIYPNPASREIHLIWDQSAITDIRIFNTEGKLLYYFNSMKISGGTELKLPDLKPGLYYMRLTGRLGTATRKLFIEN